MIILASEIENFYIEQVKKARAVGFLHKIIDYKISGLSCGKFTKQEPPPLGN